MKRFFTRWFGAKRNKRTRKIPLRTVQPRLEALEERCLLSRTMPIFSQVGPVNPGTIAGNIQPLPPGSIGLDSNGVVNIATSSKETGAEVSIQGNKVRVDLFGIKCLNVSKYQKVCNPSITQQKLFDAAKVKEIRFYGHAGQDVFRNYTGIISKAWGYGQFDILQGGSNSDELYGGDEMDELLGGGGNDKLYGQAGDDRIEGGAGDDVLDGGGGNDDYYFNGKMLSSDTVVEAANVDDDELNFSGLTGSGVTINLASTAKQTVQYAGSAASLQLTFSSTTGIEDVVGSNFKDVLKGNSRDNYLDGRGGSDELYGYEGNDSLVGDYDDDKLYAGKGLNTVSGGSGNDLIDLSENAIGIFYYSTDGGNDTVYGTPFNDVIIGSYGNDVMYGYAGNDDMTGGFGNDMLYPGKGLNTVSDGPGNDLVDLSENEVAVVYSTGGGNDTVYGTAFDDKITGSSGNDKLYGRDGNDRLFGGPGTDELYGGNGNDWLEAGSAPELADGGAGTDYNAHRWAINGTFSKDIRQGQAGTCVFLSALSGGAVQGIDLASRISYLGNYTYNVMLFTFDPTKFLFAGWDVPQQTFNVQVSFDGSFSAEDPSPAEEGEFWTVLYQRAYLAMTSELDVNFKDPDYAMYAVTGRPVATGDWDNPALVRAYLDMGLVVTAGDADETALFHEHHSYTVLNVSQANGIWYIALRNPWGYDGGNSQTSDDPNDGIIIVAWQDFQGYYDFDRISVS